MQRSRAWAGLVAIVFLFFALISYVVGAANYFLLNLILGVFALVLWATSSRETFGTLIGHRATRYGANAVVYSVGFVGLLVAINYILSLHHRRFDLTAERIFSLSPQSLKVVKELKQPLKFYGFVAQGVNPQAEALYQSYAYASPLISYELIDPDKHPELSTKFKVSVMNTTHIQYGSSGTNITDMTEQAITNGIIKVTSAGTKTACYLTGHGEPALDDTGNPNAFGRARRALEGEDYRVKPMTLTDKPGVPDECSVFIVAGPSRPVFPHEVDAVNDFLKKGGRVLVMLRPPQPDEPDPEANLISMVGQWGIIVGDNIVLDRQLRLFAGPALGLAPLVDLYPPPHPITAGFDKRTLWPMVRSVQPAKQTKPGLQPWPLAQTSDTSLAATNIEAIFKEQKFKPSPTDLKGPVTVATAMRANLKQLGIAKSGEARMVVFGDTEFANNENLLQQYNQDFFLNTIDWLAGQTATISIRPRELRASRVSLTASEFNNVFVASVLVLPELLLIIGIAVWWNRRN
ncbi:MAG TPA: Gldg family protein [Candidatus Binataceae bacterium]|nr:Gldg family protein [Candidatus Binataceae bacterium]